MKNLFNVDDRVRVTNIHSEHLNKEGNVVAVGYRSTTGYCYIVNTGIKINHYYMKKKLKRF